MKINGENEFLEFCKRNSQLVIYGAGKMGALVESFCRKKNILINCFCVTQIDEKENFLGYPVKEIAEIYQNCNGVGIIVAVSEKYSGEVLEKVKDFNYFYDKYLLHAIERSNAIEKAKERTRLVKIENNILISVKEWVFCKNNFYIVCPGSIGDTLYVASLVKAYKHRNSITSVSLIVKENQKSIPLLFASVDERIVSDELVEILDSYSRSKVVWQLDNYLYGFAREDYFCNLYMKPYEAKNLLSGYKAAILGLQEEAEYEEIWIDQTVGDPEIFNQKTIIVMPHESSAKRLPISLWEEISKNLSVNYNVYTNIKDKSELPVKGTKAVSESLKDMLPICEKCYAVISIRTGICDLLAFSKCKLIVLNTEQELSEKWDLTKVFNRDNLVNIDCYGEVDPDALKREIMLKLEEFGKNRN